LPRPRKCYAGLPSIAQIADFPTKQPPASVEKSAKLEANAHGYTLSPLRGFRMLFRSVSVGSRPRLHFVRMQASSNPIAL
jgi:hypothetical protein